MTGTSNKVNPIIIEKIYKHPIYKVFNAFSKKAAFEQWIAPSDKIRTKILSYDFKVGGKYRIKFTITEVGTSFLGGEYVHIENQKQICFTWVWDNPDIHAGINSLVTVNFIKQKEYTKLEVTHENLSTLQAVERHIQGWNGTLLRLDQLLNK